MFGHFSALLCINWLMIKCSRHTETSQLICSVNQLTGFYMRATLIVNGLKTSNKKHSNNIHNMLKVNQQIFFVFWRLDSQLWSRFSIYLCKLQPLANLAIFTGKHLHWSLFLMKLRTGKSATFLRRDSNTVFL